MTSYMEQSKTLARLSETNIFAKITHMASQLSDVTRLDSGFQDYSPPQFLLDEFKKQIEIDSNHPYGKPTFEKTLYDSICSEFSKEFNKEITYDNVCVGNGAQGITTDFLRAFLNEGDEVVVFDPKFSIYIDQIHSVVQGLTIKSVPINEDWSIDYELFENTLTNKTRIVILNSPHNPLGKIFTKEEYTKLAQIIERYPRIVVLSDEVYDKCVFDGIELQRFANIFYDRTITVVSMGKRFSCTGWRTGVMIGPKQLINLVRKSHCATAFTTFKPVYPVFGNGLKLALNEYKDGLNFYEYTNNYIENNRNYLMENLPQYDIQPLKAEGGMFLICDISKYIHKVPKKYFYKDFQQSQCKENLNCQFDDLNDADYTPDFAFVYHFLLDKKVALIPLSEFYDNSDKSHLKDYRGYKQIRIKLCSVFERYQTFIQVLEQNKQRHN